MSGRPRRQTRWLTLPVIGFFISEWQGVYEELTKPHYRLAPVPQDTSALRPYPLDMWPLLAVPLGALDEAGVPYNAPTRKSPGIYHPTTISQYGLAHWNMYLATGYEKHKLAFLSQACWLVAHETPLARGCGGWPIPFPSRDYYAPEGWLSAMTQGEGISILVRAYRLTGEEVFLQVARRALHSFELDIRDGGVSTSIGENGLFFEEVAVYPAAHILNGFLFALFGLYDYVAFTGDTHITGLIEHSLATLHTLMGGFEAGYWSYYDLLFKHLAPRFYHALHITMLEALARLSGCAHCAALAERWRGYLHSPASQLRYFITSRIARYSRGLRRAGIWGVSSYILGIGAPTATNSVRVPITAPPVLEPGLVDREVKG